MLFRSEKQERQVPVKSSILKMGRQTVFFDVNIASNNRKYLKISESHFTGSGDERRRSSFVLFPEQVMDFQTRLGEIVGELA